MGIFIKVFFVVEKFHFLSFNFSFICCFFCVLFLCYLLIEYTNKNDSFETNLWSSYHCKYWIGLSNREKKGQKKKEKGERSNNRVNNRCLFLVEKNKTTVFECHDWCDIFVCFSIYLFHWILLQTMHPEKSIFCQLKTAKNLLFWNKFFRKKS